VVQGEARRVATGAQFFVPFSFLMLLWIAVMTSGQYLLTTTIEEKSNRIMEVLLSAVSPMQLMVGKILGQMGVGLLILVMYSGLGLGALISFKLMQVLDPSNLGLLVVYFFIAYFLIAALMAAIGAAVTEIHEAQSLIGPVIMVLVIVMALSPALIRNPNGDLAVALSLIPPFSPFVMVIRIAGTEAVPAWQVVASMVIGFASVLGAAWAAAKVFRIGVLMYGKPPNLATLVRWIRMA
jgi:ABC-2 type transport system permease protein